MIARRGATTLVLAVVLIVTGGVAGIVGGRYLTSRILSDPVERPRSAGPTWRVGDLINISSAVPGLVDTRTPLKPLSNGALLVGGEDGVLREVPARSEEPAKTVGGRGFADRLVSLAVSGDGQTFAALTAKGEVRVWDQNGEILSGAIDEIEFGSLALDDSGTRLAAGGFDLRVWALPRGELASSGERISRGGAHQGQAQISGFLDDRLLLVDGGTAEAHSIQGSRTYLMQSPHCGCEESSAAWLPDGSLVAFGTVDGKIAVVEVATGQVRSIQTVEVGVGAWASVHAVLDETHILFSTSTIPLGIWNTSTKAAEWRAPFSGPIEGIGLSRDQSRIAVLEVRAADDGLSIWRGLIIRVG